MNKTLRSSIAIAATPRLVNPCDLRLTSFNIYKS